VAPFEINSAIETGTYKGESTRMLSKYFKTVDTIEIKEDLYVQSQKNNSDCKNITYHHGDSVSHLENIIKNTTAPRLYFIDAHISGPDSSWNEKEHVPLLKELEVILNNDNSDCVFIFDDLRLFDNYSDWKGISKDSIKAQIKNKNRNIFLEFDEGDRYYVILQ
jgi:hypothetical protein